MTQADSESFHSVPYSHTLETQTLYVHGNSEEQNVAIRKCPWELKWYHGKFLRVLLLGILIMDFTVYSIDDKPDSTGFMEIVSGRYKCKHWLPGSLIIWEDAFILAEKPLVELNIGYDHMGMNDLSSDESKVVTDKWKEYGKLVSGLSDEEAYVLLSWGDWHREWMPKEISKHKNEISNMFTALASGTERFINEKGKYCVLGM